MPTHTDTLMRTHSKSPLNTCIVPVRDVLTHPLVTCIRESGVISLDPWVTQILKVLSNEVSAIKRTTNPGLEQCLLTHHSAFSHSMQGVAKVSPYLIY